MDTDETKVKDTEETKEELPVVGEETSVGQQEVSAEETTTESLNVNVGEEVKTGDHFGALPPEEKPSEGTNEA